MAEATYNLNVNGETRQITTESTMPLLWALRDVCGLTGTKYGCGIIKCGACHVLVNDQLVKSCNVTVGSAASKAITTIEGLSPDDTHPVQQAWLEEQVPQCGYCQSGAILAAVTLLQRTPNPSDAEIDQAIANICACGTYPRMKAAIKRAAGLS